MIEDKVSSLRKALLYSYQAETIELADGRQFRCLINPNKLSMELDDKMLSIPFDDICLNQARPEGETTTEGRQQIPMKPGDIITWIHKNHQTHWIVYLQYLQEKAYFKGLMRQCDAQVEINGSNYWVYLKGPDEKGIDWTKTKHSIFNDLNYTLEMYISNTQETNEFFQRFKIVNIQGNHWEVQAVDRLTTDGILCVYLKEHYSNEYDVQVKEEVPPIEEEPATSSNVPQIIGPAEVHPFDIVTYSVTNANGGAWLLSNKRARILESDGTYAKIEITSGKSGDVTLIYDDNEDIYFNIHIASL